MRTTRHPVHHVLPRVGRGLLLAGLGGGPILPAGSAAGMEAFEDQPGRGAQRPSGSQPPWSRQEAREPNAPGGYRHDQLALRELGYGLPDRYTIHQGQTCERRCERIRRSREYRCREYRC
jgi:hypothetical protein